MRTEPAFRAACFAIVRSIFRTGYRLKNILVVPGEQSEDPGPSAGMFTHLIADYWRDRAVRQPVIASHNETLRECAEPHPPITVPPLVVTTLDTPIILCLYSYHLAR